MPLCSNLHRVAKKIARLDSNNAAPRVNVFRDRRSFETALNSGGIDSIVQFTELTYTPPRQRERGDDPKSALAFLPAA